MLLLLLLFDPFCSACQPYFGLIAKNTCKTIKRHAARHVNNRPQAVNTTWALSPASLCMDSLAGIWARVSTPSLRDQVKAFLSHRNPRLRVRDVCAPFSRDRKSHVLPASVPVLVRLCVCHSAWLAALRHCSSLFCEEFLTNPNRSFSTHSLRGCTFLVKTAVP